MCPACSRGDHQHCWGTYETWDSEAGTVEDTCSCECDTEPAA
jgi:hypothetical protein